MTKQKCLNKTTTLITAFFITLFVITTLQAQTLNVEGASPLEIYHFTGVKVEGKLKHNTLILLSQEIGINETITPKFFVPRGIVVTSKIMDQNPLLFTYDSKLETYETDDYKIFKELLPKVDSVLTAMTNFVIRDPDEPTITALETTIGKIRKFVNDRGEIIDLTLDEFKVPIAKKRVLDWTLSEVKEQLADDYEKVEAYWLKNNTNLSFKKLELIRSQSIFRLFQPNIRANSLAMFCTKCIYHKDPLSTMQCEKRY